MMRYRWFIITVMLGLALTSQMPLLARNLTGVLALHYLACVGVFGPSPLLDGCPENAAHALLQASESNSNFMQNLDTGVRIENQPEGQPWIAAQDALAVYHYGLGMRAMEQANWPQSLEHFQRAVTDRPGPWSGEFYTRYRNVLSYTVPHTMARITVEEMTEPATAPTILVGRKEQPGWDTPIAIGVGWQLEGLAVRSWTAVEQGLPVTVDLFWKSSAGSVERQTVVNENMMPNGGFELGANWAPTRIAGWYGGKDDEVSLATCPVLSGQSSTCLAILPRGLEGVSGAGTRLIPLAPHVETLLWSARIETKPGGNPHILVSWIDRNKMPIKLEIPFQGNVTEPSQHHAGVLQIPENAAYIQIELANWKASGEVWFDDLLLLPLKPPAH
jgi:hypothetical protein